jgi:hypothetical protein
VAPVLSRYFPNLIPVFSLRPQHHWLKRCAAPVVSDALPPEADISAEKIKIR